MNDPLSIYDSDSFMCRLHERKRELVEILELRRWKFLKEGGWDADLNASLEGEVQTPSMYQVILQIFISLGIHVCAKERKKVIIKYRKQPVSNAKRSAMHLERRLEPWFQQNYIKRQSKGSEEWSLKIIKWKNIAMRENAQNEKIVRCTRRQMGVGTPTGLLLCYPIHRRKHKKWNKIL